MESWDAQKMLDKYIYNYLVKKGLNMTAEIFATEADVVNPDNVAIESPEGFLIEWWDVFYEKFSSNQAERSLEPYSEAHNISPLVPAFHLRTPEDEALFDLRFLEMDRPSTSQSQRVPFVTDSSRQLEQIPNNASTMGGQR